MQDKHTTNVPGFADIASVPQKGRIVALDLGTKWIGVAVCDELQITTRRVKTIQRKGWKKFLKEIIAYLKEFDAEALVLGLPYNFDGSESEMSTEARRLARNFSLSIDIPVFLQDERTTTYQARSNLWKLGREGDEVLKNVDSEAAAIILDDFIEQRNQLIKNRGL